MEQLVSTIDSGAPFDRLLAAFAHPDDEAFTCGGTFAALADRGVAITLLCATRGEAGEIRVPELATRDDLGAVREEELRAAMALLGVTDVRFLGYRDSGMAGTPDNDDPRAFAQATETEVADRIAAAIRQVRPAVVITFGPDGVYGHPDHVAVHRATTAAVLGEGARRDGWRVRALYYATVPRERIQERARQPNGPFRDFTPEQIARLGTPLAEITTIVDVGPNLARKRAAMEAHRTQFGDGGPLRDFPREEVDRWLSREHFVRVPLPWDDAAAPFDPLPVVSAVPVS
jgi:N-acetyl-1-D-myo-inositol-2-amino-2-deoxy-alpha-D-glucopyranoside deacetylase